MTEDEWEIQWGGVHPGKLIDPMACRNCGIAKRDHFQRWARNVGWHRWTMPTLKQIKYRMIRRRKHHGAIRWR